MKATSPTQLRCLAHLHAHSPLPLIRLPGGIWTTPDCAPAPGTNAGFPPRDQWFGSTTVSALVHAGRIWERTGNKTPRLQEYVLTPALVSAQAPPRPQATPPPPAAPARRLADGSNLFVDTGAGLA